MTCVLACKGRQPDPGRVVMVLLHRSMWCARIRGREVCRVNEVAALTQQLNNLMFLTAVYEECRKLGVGHPMCSNECVAGCTPQ